MIPSRDLAAKRIAFWFKNQDEPVTRRNPLEFVPPETQAWVHLCVQRHASLQWLIKQLCAVHTPPSKVRSVLYVGLVQILWDNRAPDFAVLNETVETARRLAGPKAAGFVNAVLRRAVREKQEWLDKLAAEKPATRYSHPARLWKQWVRQWDEERAAQVCEWNNREPQRCLRWIGGDGSDILEQMKAADLPVEPHPADPKRFARLTASTQITYLPGFDEGRFYMQDPSTTLAVDLLNAQAGETVLDACAARGGKTLLLAEALKGQGTLIASDANADRLGQLHANLSRTKTEGVTVIARSIKDLRLGTDLPEEGVDALLLDVPCSNTGVLQRRPEARWRYRPDTLPDLEESQRALLHFGADLVRPGGRMVYSTCSSADPENIGLVTSWLEEHPGWTLEDHKTLIPGENDTDGAFAAVLRKDT